MYLREIVENEMRLRLSEADPSNDNTGGGTQIPVSDTRPQHQLKQQEPTREPTVNKESTKSGPARIQNGEDQRK